jgi:hypothetical protein
MSVQIGNQLALDYGELSEVLDPVAVNHDETTPTEIPRSMPMGGLFGWNLRSRSFCFCRSSGAADELQTRGVEAAEADPRIPERA